MLSFFYLFKLLQTDFTIRERRDKKYAKPLKVLLILVVGRRRKQRVVCRDEREREREIASRVLVCARLLIEESTVMDLPPNTSRHPLLARKLFKIFQNETKKLFFTTTHRRQKKKKKRAKKCGLDSFFFSRCSLSLFWWFASSFSFECRSFRSFSLSFFPPDLSSFSI